MTEQDFENIAMNVAAEAFPGDIPTQEQREGDRLRAFLIRQYELGRRKPDRPVFED